MALPQKAFGFGDLMHVPSVDMPTRIPAVHWQFRPRLSRQRNAFTLVELLTVIVIIGTLLALLLPAIQAAREAARQNQCKSHLRQVGLAMHLHHSLHRTFPSGGWGWRWVGDPDRGTGLRQPGGWIFSLLPFIEQEQLFELGKGTKGADKVSFNTQRIQISLSAFHCPSRRTAESYPMGYVGYPAYNALDAARVAKTDYAANAGDLSEILSPDEPKTFEQGDEMATQAKWPVVPASAMGVCYLRSEVRDAHIRDGLSNTYLVGEKYMHAGSYSSGLDWADNEPCTRAITTTITVPSV